MLKAENKMFLFLFLNVGIKEQYKWCLYCVCISVFIYHFW